jgi:hypothetical protein
VLQRQDRLLDCRELRVVPRIQVEVGTLDCQDGRI